MPVNKSKRWIEGRGWVKVGNNECGRNYDDFLNDSWALLISFFRWYPDLMCDVFRSPEARYQNLELIQRVMMRTFARFRFVDITGCRSLTKTSTKMLQKICENILIPGTNSSYYGPSYKQQAILASKAFENICSDYPALAMHYSVEKQAKDSWAIATATGSSITINALRGQNIHDVTAEEFAQEENPPFDFKEYSSIVLYAIRLTHRVNGEDDPTVINFKQHTITSAGRKQNHSYLTRCKHLKLMHDGKSAFVMDVNWRVIVLSQMRPYEWVLQRKSESTPDEWAREMESLYSGTDKNPMVRDSVLTESRDLIMMEEHHCCKDRDNKLAPEDVIYIICYDVSYEDSKDNAKCALGVLKLTKQTDFFRRDKYRKELVYITDWSPFGMTDTKQAQRVKQYWYRFCFEGSQTYIAIDGWQYGRAVVEKLMSDLGDGLAPLCIMDHEKYDWLELEGAIPVIYPIKAGGVGVTDPDSEMIRYAEIQFENNNVGLLTADMITGVESYKKFHRIKDDSLDAAIAHPYKKTNELINQIQNLKVAVSGAGLSEKRISRHIQRDGWSALKYGLRLAQKLEKSNLLSTSAESDWDIELKKFNESSGISPAASRGRTVTSRHGGRIC